MSVETVTREEKPSECRALVPVTVSAAARETAARYRMNAAFVTQLSANAKGFPLYCAKRRVKPETGAGSYRTTIADALAYRPNGQKLNYCA